MVPTVLENHMQPTRDLADSIYLERVARARETPLEEKLMAGPRLFAFGCETMRMGIRLQNPSASAEEVERLLRQRFDLARKLEGFKRE
jgi:hypothetical protein